MHKIHAYQLTNQVMTTWIWLRYYAVGLETGFVGF